MTDPDPSRRRLVVLDVDSTLITAEVIELLADRAGARERVAEITERAMRGELDFAASLAERVATLAGLPASVVDEVAAEVELSPGALELLDGCARRGWPVGVVSGGFVEVVGPLAHRLGVTHHRANRLAVADGRFTGRTEGPVVDRAAKAAALREWALAEGVAAADTIAIGDGANDIDMVVAAGLGAAFRPKPALAAVADVVLAERLDELFDHLGE